MYPNKVIILCMWSGTKQYLVRRRTLSAGRWWKELQSVRLFPQEEAMVQHSLLLLLLLVLVCVLTLSVFLLFYLAAAISGLAAAEQEAATFH